MVHVVDAAAGVVTDNIVVGTRPRRLLLLPDGKELWVSNELSGQVTVIDRAANRVATTLDFCRRDSVRSTSRPSDNASRRRATTSRRRLRYRSLYRF